MDRCVSCGADLPVTAARCPYCGTSTPYGKLEAVRRAEDAEEAERLEAEIFKEKREEARESLERTARHALLWSLGGLICCLVPVGAVVALVLGFRARTLAKKYDLVIPMASTLAIVLGGVGIAAFIAFGAMGVVSYREHQARLERIQAAIGDRDQATYLLAETACKMAELKLVTSGWGEHTGVDIDEVECLGGLIQRDDRAALYDLRVNIDSTLNTLAVCLVRTDRWRIKELRADNRCD